MGSKFSAWCLYKKRRVHTEGHTGKAMWQQRQMVAWCRNKPRNAKGCWQSPEAGREYESDSPSETPEGISPADTLILNFSPPEQWENKFLLYEATQFMVLYYGSPRKLIYHLVPTSLKARYCTYLEKILLDNGAIRKFQCLFFHFSGH